ncbi:MAG: 2Fe-2S iron-sulfur cluster-binding protein [Bacteroidota bacterium]
MPQITIDGKPYEYEGDHMLLQFALDNGVEIPYFCYHPAMSIPTNCRMCLVEVGWPAKDRKTGELKRDEEGKMVVNWGRKPATACNTPLSPDLVVLTHRSSPKVKEMQKGVLEYMLVNHPLDCPICDQAGECPLQIWTYKYGPEGSRFESSKVHKPKRVELGPNVILDAERCINCTRCVRFTEEISKTAQLTIIGRGDKNYPMTAPGKVFDDPYSMCTIDLCPVGALTSKHFRFKARTWEMSYAPGLCTGCARSCSVNVWVRDNKVMRLTPRGNPRVNNYWMCDKGRLDIDKYNDHRVSGIKLKGDVPVEFQTGINKAIELLRAHPGPITFLGSAHASLESNIALRDLARSMGVETVHYVSYTNSGWGDEILRKDDKSANGTGCELLGLEAIDPTVLRDRMAAGEIGFLYMLEDNQVLEILGDALDKATVIAHATNYHDLQAKVDVILPAAMSIEMEGTYLNGDMVPQVSKMAKQIKQMTPEMWMRVPKSRLDKAAVAIDRWRDLENIFDVLPGWQMLSSLALGLGHNLGFNHHKDVFAKLQSEIEVLGEVKISYKVPKEAFKFTQYDFAIT